jgi:hypothetical protein
MVQNTIFLFSIFCVRIVSINIVYKVCGAMENWAVNKAGKGKRDNQKMKPYLVMEYLIKNTDESHYKSAADIIAYLNDCGIEAERRSIYKDIEEINKAVYIVENEASIQEAEDLFSSDDGEEEQFVIYDKNKKGFSVRRSDYSYADILLLAECVYAAKFIDDKTSKRLVNTVGKLLSDFQADDIKKEVFLLDRVKTENPMVYFNINTITEAMRYGTRHNPHRPEKITFQYEKHTIDGNGIHTKSSRKTVSPFKLMMNDGYYYLLAYQGKRLSTFRVDRMKSVNLTGEPRDCEEEFSFVDLQDYANSNFGMMINTKKVRVTLKCKSALLDTMIDRFGTKGIHYTALDDKHFTVDPRIELNHQFYGWVCGLGEDIQIIGPDFVVERYADYLERVRAIYPAPAQS